MSEHSVNSCVTCDHKQNPDGGWCYMFREEPQAPCLTHTGMKFFAALASLPMVKEFNPEDHK